MQFKGYKVCYYDQKRLYGDLQGSPETPFCDIVVIQIHQIIQ